MQVKSTGAGRWRLLEGSACENRKGAQGGAQALTVMAAEASGHVHRGLGLAVIGVGSDWGWSRGVGHCWPMTPKDQGC